MNRKNRAHLHLVWEGEASYLFLYDIQTVRETAFKKIYTGCFSGSAPPGLTPEKDYCIKIIHVVPDHRYAQCREYYDLVDFQGSHLRRICAANPSAQQVCRRLRQGQPLTETTNCIVVEPLYRTTAHLFRNCGRMSVGQRLDLIRQYATGCLQLQNRANRLGLRSIISYRDMKGPNGVLDPEENDLHIRLIDFASIRLEPDGSAEPSGPPKAPARCDQTAGCAMSQSNTTIEHLSSRFPASEKTDVYALGMMLASLFFRVDLEYANPNQKWTALHGWQGDDVSNAALLKAFEECLTRWEPTASWDDTWVERALRRGGVSFTWEPLAQPGLLKQIRTLFFHATRIDPAQRLNLALFLKMLEKLCTAAEAGQQTIPVSLYLFSRPTTPELRQRYLRAALEAFRAEHRAAQQQGGPTPHALCMVYPGGMDDAEVLPLAETAATNAEELTEAVRRCPTGPQGTDRTVRALLDSLLTDPGAGCSLSGTIHLFAPSTPDAGMVIQLDGKPLNPEELAEKMLGIHRISILVHSDGPPGSPDAPSWMRRVPLPPAENTPDPTRRTPAPSPVEDDPVFFTGLNASFIWDSQGKKVYVGMKY